jgi:hypothetical protein
MNENTLSGAACRVAVIMERAALRNRWLDEKWEAKGVVQEVEAVTAAGSAPRVIVRTERTTQLLFPGHRIELKRDEAEGYYLNLTSPEPKVFVLWRLVDDVAQPQRLTVSYGEGARWADSGEQVDGVAIPTELIPWIAEYVEAHYRPEPPKPKRYASSRDKGRMGRVES